MAHKLVIVESPAKARTIGGYLGQGYVVESSIGHIRDLPQSAAETPAKIKDKPWGRLAVDVDNGFEPYYVVPRDKKQHISKLKTLLKDADELYLATDEDREGEAIAWHLLDELKPKGIPVHRMVFHEITKPAILAAVESPREINDDLVEAQEARRILDRLYGYEVSPVLWKKVMSGLSAGRVQSVATRLVVDRERERMAFRVASYWDLEATFDGGADKSPRMFPGKLHSIDDTRVATGSDFGDDGQLKDKKGGRVHLDRAGAEVLVQALADTTFEVRSVESKPYRRQPYAPFRTTTLQQEASRKLGMSASVAMSVAQRLYENGFITYMRTDSTTLSSTAVGAARAQARELYGEEYVPDQPREYASKVKNAQEAHEAIRPSGETFRTPAQTGLTGEQFRLYELIWMRTVASQMKDAVGQSVSVRLGGGAADGRDVVFSASGRVITFHGFLKAYVEGTEGGKRSDDDQVPLPELHEGDPVTAASLNAQGHETKPPARYTEATLIKELEDREIGRPSTYASIIGTILNRGYVYKKGTALVPAWLAFSVIRLLEEHFPRQISYEFTAGMEDVLDEIAAGRKDRNTELGEFYFGSDRVEGLHHLITNLGEIDARELATFPIGGPDSGINLRVGRYGPYLEGPDDEGNPTGKRANVPDDLPPDELTLEKAKELFANPAGEEIQLGVHPETGLEIVAKNGRYGPYVTEALPDNAKKNDKPRTGSLFKSMSLDTITLDDAVKLLSLPRVVGVDPESGEEITAQNGRYGPYLKKGTDSRSLTAEDQLLTIGLDEALRIYAQPKQRGRAAAAPPLKELGNDPVSGQPVVVKSGRFGEYVTDGEYNATLRKDDTVEAITLERAAELLAERRERGPAKKAAKKGAKKAPATKAAAKKTAKKTAKKATKKS
ncbi:MAG TPA: type I DNA topoisomerase [Nocardioides sp.]|uniref:type I DNA topoisomerase n=1 Tax=uncultured Nocardioides sp. TaxID=198441 RepID=UPI000ED45703|nr:type I DNA topoisomerase [uncultured Nocardioides sp.]HCB03698.1 type I DNA topoisomerase [Nocardioides sp.]HRD60390.1 type I DNA topoisomerase [Nocardioides sp.]HRI94846.1 type I DNA topoisomerase [Nocardioides sp.]HRK45634.1 type I DNA topoisomerase [Nocardioides sp.]